MINSTEDAENMPELIFTIDVKCLEAVSVKGHTRDIVMVPFTGTASGVYFNGSVTGTGTDTQKLSKSGECTLSARYILSGKDMTGADCKLFIENETRADGKLRPMIVTDSEALAFLETAALYSEIVPADGGVTVRIYREKQM